MTSLQIDSERIELAKKIALEAGATRFMLFGSAATSPQTARDLDFACAGVDGWKLFELGARLEQALKMEIDLVPLEPSNRFTESILVNGIDLL